jgi:hypothetical protein
MMNSPLTVAHEKCSDIDTAMLPEVDATGGKHHSATIAIPSAPTRRAAGVSISIYPEFECSRKQSWRMR